MTLEKFRESVACHLPMESRFYLVATGSLSKFFFFFFLLNIFSQYLPNLHPLAFCSPFPQIISCLQNFDSFACLYKFCISPSLYQLNSAFPCLDIVYSDRKDAYEEQGVGASFIRCSSLALCRMWLILRLAAQLFLGSWVSLLYFPWVAIVLLCSSIHQKKFEAKQLVEKHQRNFVYDF